MRMFHPILGGARLPDRLLACLGAAIGIAVTIVTCSSFVHAPLPAIVAPLGASAVLVFAVPSSPLAQPWSVIGGNTLSALVGIAMFRVIPDPMLSAAAAVGGAILIMSLCRCLHPPGGAAALTAVIGGDAVHHAGYGFALLPVGVNSLALVLIGIGFHRLAIHRYPRRVATAPLDAGTRIHPADIDLALGDMHETFDIDRQDLEVLLAHAERHALERRTRVSARGAPGTDIAAQRSKPPPTYGERGRN
jgi:CBS domain-containing membrane protein